MFVLRSLGLGVALPALVALGVLLALGRGAPSRRSWVLAAVALGLGYIAGHLALHGQRGLLPLDVLHRLPLVALAACALTLLDAPGSGVARQLALDVAAAATAGYLLLAPLSPHRFSGVMLAAVLGGFVVTALLMTRAVGAALSGERPGWRAGALSLIAGAVAGLAASSGSALIGQCCGMLAAASGALSVLALARKSTDLESAARVLAVLLAAVGALAYFYAEMRPEVLAAVALAPLLFGTSIRALRGRPGSGLALGVVTALAVLGFAGHRATRPAPAAKGAPATAGSAGTGDNEYGYR